MSRSRHWRPLVKSRPTVDAGRSGRSDGAPVRARRQIWDLFQAATRRAATSPNALSQVGWRAERAQGSKRGGEFGQRVGFAQLRSSYLLHGRIKCRSAAIAGAPLGGATDMVVRLIGGHAINDLKRRPELSEFSK